MIVMAPRCEAIYGDGPAVECHEPADFVIDSTEPGGSTHLCAKHTKAHLTPTCEVSITLDDTDAGGPYDFVPCDKAATRIIHWTTDGGMDITVGLCDFHATGEI